MKIYEASVEGADDAIRSLSLEFDSLNLDEQIKTVVGIRELVSIRYGLKLARIMGPEVAT